MRHFTCLAAVSLFVIGCQKAAPPPEQTQAQGPAPGTPEWKIQNAMSAAPQAIAAAAAVMDWPAAEGGEMAQLRAGTNGWTCLPDLAGTPSNDPMCVDQTFLTWAGAYMARKPVNITQAGFSYMLQGGEGSNTDPYATAPTADNQWGKEGPHVMMIVPNPAALSGLTTDPNTGGPWLMWKGTPYAHVMMPTNP